MKKLLTFLIATAICATSAFGALDWTYGWEDGVGTALGTYGNAIVSNSTEQAYEGTHSLKLIEDPIDGTPQAFVWWVTGLSSGDTVNASFYCYDTTPDGSPSGRIWGHYTDGVDVNSYKGSANGNETYPAGNGWTNLQHEWVFITDGLDGRTGLVVEARIYSAADANVLYFDTASITVSRETALIYNAAGDALPEPLMISAFALGILALFVRRK